MSIRLHVGQLARQNITFSYSVLGELLLSLQVLSAYRHYPLHVTWALARLRELPPDFLGELRLFNAVFRQTVTLFWPPDAAVPDFAQELALLQAQPVAEFCLPLLAAFLYDGAPGGKQVINAPPTLAAFQADGAQQAQMRQWLSNYFPDSVELVDLLVTDPAGLQTRFLTLLQSYWDEYFSDYWATLEPQFLAEISQRGRLLYEADTLTALDGLTGRLSLNRAGSIITFPGLEADDFVLSASDELQLRPTYFTPPGLIFALKHLAERERKQVSLTYPLPGLLAAGRSPAPPEELLTLLRAISDSTRLQILQLVAAKPRPTSELARIIGLSDAAISRQLKQLQAAGWVSAERQSYFVLYRAEAEPVRALSEGLAGLLAGS